MNKPIYNVVPVKKTWDDFVLFDPFPFQLSFWVYPSDPLEIRHNPSFVSKWVENLFYLYANVFMLYFCVLVERHRRSQAGAATHICLHVQRMYSIDVFLLQLHKHFISVKKLTWKRLKWTKVNRVDLNSQTDIFFESREYWSASNFYNIWFE